MKLLSVRELTLYIKDILENDRLLTNLWVKGEISNFKRASSGHMYFTLKDVHSCIRSVMFSSRARTLAFEPEDGMAVRVRGYVSLYERDGNYQLYVQEMEPDGLGALYLAFEQLKEKLSREGIFDARHKKSLPLLPGCIGIVTSPTGAVIRDMVNIIGRRWPGVKIILVPVAVQGNAAPGEVAEGIKKLNRLGGVDVIIAGRGGGSLEELWAFNTENVARAIFASSIPVISAVGHETDFTIADMVADLRAPTPSAAAEMVVPVKKETDIYISTQQGRLKRALDDYLKRCRARLDMYCRSPVFRSPVDRITGTRKMHLDFLTRRLEDTIRNDINRRKGSLATMAVRLNALSPLSTLVRGYSICLSEETGEVLKDAAQVSPGDGIKVRLRQGALLCRVRETLNEGDM
jgi:exodeoxyribonuclease VII large subunit